MYDQADLNTEPSAEAAGVAGADDAAPRQGRRFVSYCARCGAGIPASQLPRPQAAPARKPGSRNLWVAVAVVTVALTCFVILPAGCVGMAAVMFSVAGKSVAEPADGRYGVEEFPQMDAVWIGGARAGVPVVKIPIRGTISLASGEGGGLLGSSTENSSVRALKAIRRATLDKGVKGILLDIGSGGGGITDSDILYDALVSFKAADPERVIVALFRDTAASGAYYLSLAADEIVAHPTTITGSIGVIMQSVNVKELADKIGVKDNSIVSGANKALMNPLQDVTPEQQEMMQAIVDELHSRFVGLVAENRGIPEEEVREFADGRILTARQALSLKLIDKIGYARDAEGAVVDLLGPGVNVKFIRYEQKHSFSDIFTSPSFWGASISHAVRETAAMQGEPGVMAK